jgi:anthranilate phosphoribosyltransferase
VSSTCGSADVIEMLGLPLKTEPGDVAGELAGKNFVFLFAPLYHPAFAKVAPVRKELGIRTLFNLMGPLLNPARPTHQLLGVARAAIAPLMAEVLHLTGCRRAAVVHGAGGYDELTPFGPATVVWVREDGLEQAELDPLDLGIPRHAPEDVAVASKDEALAVMREVLAGKGPAAMRDMVALNLGLAIHLLEDGRLDLAAAVDRAREAVAAGAAGHMGGGADA